MFKRDTTCWPRVCEHDDPLMTGAPDPAQPESSSVDAV
jgi:hypothetical protein